MSIKDLYVSSDALRLAECIKSGEVSARELVEVAIECIEETNPQLNAVVAKRYDYALELAGRARTDTPFSGVPFLLKDVEWEGFTVNRGSVYLKDRIVTSSSEMANRMKAAGLVPLGQTNVPEFNRGSTTEPRLFGPTKNPWHPEIVPGGSSGGAGAAVASRMVPIAQASDAGGSIRIPASLNGLVGLKPSRGRITHGPSAVDLLYGAAVYLCVSRSVRDTAAFLDAVAGALPGEPYALPVPERSYLSLLSDEECRRLKVGFAVTEPNGQPLGLEQRLAVERAVEACEALGHEVSEANFKYDYERFFEVTARLQAPVRAAAIANVAAKVGRAPSRDEIENANWEVIQLGHSLTAVQHCQDIEAMRALARDFVMQFNTFDVVISPVLADLPHSRGWLDTSLDLATYGKRLSGDLKFTQPQNYTGQPAISLPLHETQDGKPIGVQFTGRIGEDATLIVLAGQLERLLPWSSKKPRVVAG